MEFNHRFIAQYDFTARGFSEYLTKLILKDLPFERSKYYYHDKLYATKDVYQRLLELKQKPRIRVKTKNELQRIEDFLVKPKDPNKIDITKLPLVWRAHYLKEEIAKGEEEINKLLEESEKLNKRIEEYFRLHPRKPSSL